MSSRLLRSRPRFGSFPNLFQTHFQTAFVGFRNCLARGHVGSGCFQQHPTKSDRARQTGINSTYIIQLLKESSVKKGRSTLLDQKMCGSTLHDPDPSADSHSLTPIALTMVCLLSLDSCAETN